MFIIGKIESIHFHSIGELAEFLKKASPVVIDTTSHICFTSDIGDCKYIAHNGWYGISSATSEDIVMAFKSSGLTVEKLFNSFYRVT